MRPGPTGWAIVVFLGVVAWTGEGGALAKPPGAGEAGVGTTRAAATEPAEARVRWVLDRIEEEVAVIVAGEESRSVPRRTLGRGAREGDLLDERLAPLPAATARARAEVARLRNLAAEAAPPGEDAAGAEVAERPGEASRAPTPPAGSAEAAKPEGRSQTRRAALRAQRASEDRPGHLPGRFLDGP